MKLSAAIFAGAVLLSSFAVSSRADLIDLGLHSLTLANGNPDTEGSWIVGRTDTPETSLDYLWKTGQPTGDGEVSGSLFTVAGVNTAEATVSWNLTGTGFELRYVLLKDGVGLTQGSSFYHLYQVTPSQYLIGDSSNLPGGTVEIDGTRAISHISFFGIPGSGPGTGVGVPDGGMTLVLMGLALSALAAGRRFLRV